MYTYTVIVKMNGKLIFVSTLVPFSCNVTTTLIPFNCDVTTRHVCFITHLKRLVNNPPPTKSLCGKKYGRLTKLTL